MNNLLETFEKKQIERLTGKKRIPTFRPGDTLKVTIRITEGDKTRLQAFEGMCIARKNNSLNSNFTVRKMSHGEGVDQRAIDILGFEEVSIGDYVLAGGEIAAQVLLEGCIRLIPGVLGHPNSLLEESFSNNLLEYPHYTRPKIWEDSLGNTYDVPEVLTSGHHSNIKKWRQDKSVEKTKKIRPDLYSKKEQEQD